jgi:hypothetical protein
MILLHFVSSKSYLSPGGTPCLTFEHFFQIKAGALSFIKKEKQSYNLSLQRPKHINKPSRETKEAATNSGHKPDRKSTIAQKNRQSRPDPPQAQRNPTLSNSAPAPNPS